MSRNAAVVLNISDVRKKLERNAGIKVAEQTLRNWYAEDRISSSFTTPKNTPMFSEQDYREVERHAKKWAGAIGFIRSSSSSRD